MIRQARKFGRNATGSKGFPEGAEHGDAKAKLDASFEACEKRSR
jgi:hypothetical protein